MVARLSPAPPAAGTVGNMTGPDVSLRLSALIVCVNYWDFLRLTLPLNRVHFNEIVVVTAPGDDRTMQVCADLDVTCCVTDEFYIGNASFNKGRAINRALHSLTDPKWVALMDADIVLPPTFRRRLSSSGLDPAKLYTCDRHVCDTPDLWDNIQRGAKHLYHHQAYPAEDFLYIPPWDQITKRLTLPLGFLQIVHCGGILSKLGYPTTSDNANWSDVEFSQCYPVGDRVWIDDMRVIHLGTTGGNENGLTQPDQRSWN
jgi:glycosyltransferase involved in cell wall biosynthesis